MVYGEAESVRELLGVSVKAFPLPYKKLYVLYIGPEIGHWFVQKANRAEYVAEAISTSGLLTVILTPFCDSDLPSYKAFPDYIVFFSLFLPFFGYAVWLIGSVLQPGVEPGPRQ